MGGVGRVSKTKPPSPFFILADSAEPHPDAGDHEDALFRPSVLHRGVWYDVYLDRANMSEGDYSLPGLCLSKPMLSDGPWQGEPVVAIERKSRGDAISTIVGTTTTALGESASNRDRFAAELERLRAYAFRCIVIEAFPSDIEHAASDPRRRFNPYAVIQSYMAFAPRFGVQVWWAGNRRSAEWYVGATLARIWDEHTGGEAWKKVNARGEAAVIPWARETPTDAAREVMARAAARAEAERKAAAPCAWCNGSGEPCACNDGRPQLEPTGGMPPSTAEYERRRGEARSSA